MTLAEPHVRVERFRYTSFDAPQQEKKAAPAKPEAKTAAVAQAAEPPPPPPPPMFSEQQLEAAKQAAFAQGKQAGLREAEEARNREAEAQQQAMKQLLELTGNRITLASQEHMQRFQKQQDLLLKLTMGIARKVAGEALKREPTSAVESLLRECLGLIMDNQRIAISVAPSRYEGLRQSIDTLKQYIPDYQGEIVVEGDATLGEQDCRVDWGKGHALRSVDGLWNDIETLLRKTPLTNF